MPFNREAFKAGVMYLIVFLLAILFYLSPSSPETAEHDVFLNFRGEDVRNNFVSHLHAALLKNSIKAFIDDKLRRGESIAPALLDAIADSRIAVIVFSKNYALSTWCLDELAKIMECHAFSKTAIPIFYEVNPSDVGNQSGVFAQAFAEHEENFKHSDQVFRWRIALTVAANIAGWDSKNIKPEANLISEVVQEISRKLALLASPALREKIKRWAGYVLLYVLSVVIFFFKSAAGDYQSQEKPERYDVFVNYYGEESLVSELYDALNRKGLKTFRDKGLVRGTEFTKEIKDAIVRSNVAVIIFTKSFAASTGCLDALVKIMEYQDYMLNRRLRVVPVYYRVDLTELLEVHIEESFAIHKKRWGGKEKVKKWKNAIKRATADSLTREDGQQEQGETFIDAIVRKIKIKMDD